MREHGVPQFTVDTHRPAGAFDVLGVNLSAELVYTNLLTASTWPGFRCRARTGTRDGTWYPLVIAGGHAAFNPEPIADFVDGVVIGDGEEAVLADHARSAEWKRGGRARRPRRAAARAGRRVPASTSRASTTSSTRTGGSRAVTPDRRDVPPVVAKRTVVDLADWPYPKQADRAAHRDRARPAQRRDLPRLHPGLPVLPGGDDHPAGARAEHRPGAPMVDEGRAPRPATTRSACSRCPAPTSAGSTRSPRTSPTPTRARNTGLSLPSTRVDAFNVEPRRRAQPEGAPHRPHVRARGRHGADAQGDQQDGHRGRPDPDRRRPRTRSGWRQVKLYFMCGLPTETDEDMLAIAELARKVIQAGREATGRRDIRCTVSIGGFVPKPHTPFQWAAQCDHEVVDARLRKLGAALRSDPAYGRAIGFRYHDGKPSVIEGLLSRGDRRVGAVIRRRGGTARASTTGASTSRSTAGRRARTRRLDGEPVDLDWYMTRERDRDEVLPWDHLDAGLDHDWLWQDWQDALSGAAEVDDCRWTPCYDCGVCPSMGTEIQTGPTGERLPAGTRLLPVLNVS